MADFPFDIVGFDLDGTLFDTSGDLTAAVNHALALAGRPPFTVEQVKPMIGHGARRMLERGLEASGGCTPELVRELFGELLVFYESNLTRHSKPFPGLLDAMDALDARGVKLGIVTNKFEYLAVKLVAELGMTDRFACVIGGDTMGRGNAKPSRLPIDEMIARCRALGGGDRAAFVGDSELDTGAARNAGIPSIGVGFGFLLGPVEDLGADAVIDSYAELIPTLERLALS